MAIYLVAGAVLVFSWYLGFSHYNRRKAAQTLQWIEAALAGKGEVVGTRWLGPSLFHVALRLGTTVFHHPGLLVRLTPREMPLNWFFHWWRSRPETLTFEADLDVPPVFNLEVHRHRWFGRTSRRVRSLTGQWEFDSITPFIMTSRRNWHREVTSMMNTLLTCREREFVALAFHCRSPHFAATVTLQSLSPQEGAGSNVFDMLRELAAGASASRF